ncbi:hypothetical protein ACHAWC_004386 [Mediolabrus comicus]
MATPYWTSPYDELSKQSSTPLPLQRLFNCLVAVAYIPILCPLTTFGYFVDDESFFDFDEVHSSNFLTLLRVTTGLSPFTLYVCGSLTASFYATLIWADLSAAKLGPFRWPIHWDTDNNACYDDMFCEPSRNDRLIRRPGNTLSNFFYLFFAIVVIASSVARAFNEEKKMFILSDALFGIMLFILSISSTLWHACNCLWSHASCLLIYLTHIILNGRNWMQKHNDQFWHNHCPLAVRNRLPNSPYVHNASDTSNKMSLGPIALYEVYLFALLPVIHNAPSWILAACIFESFGSLCLARILNVSLTVGWVYRMTERWAFDACRHMLLISEKIESAESRGEGLKAFIWRTLAATLSPTAALHYCTGVTIIAAFCHSRSVEMTMLQKTFQEVV